MALNANNSKNTGGGPRQTMEPGTYPARLVMVVDLGLQAQRPFQGQEKAPAYEVLLTYEFVDEFMKDDDGNDIPEKPRWISESFPLYSLDSERAKSTARYNAFDPNHVHGGDWVQLLGEPVLVTVINNPGKDGRVYENVAAVSSMRAKDAARTPELVNEAVVFDGDTPDKNAFEKLPKWIQDKIRKGLEFKGSKVETVVGKESATTDSKSSAKTEPKEAPEDDLDDDENPF